jgi:predicted ester cyclase
MSTAADLARPSEAPSNVEIVARLFDEAFNAGNLDTLAELVHPDFTNFGRTAHGPQFLAALIRAQRTAFPDMRFDSLQTLAADDWVITKMRWTGTFQAGFGFIGFAGIEPTGRTFDVEHVHAFRLAEGKIAEHWAIRDDLTMHDQLLGMQIGNRTSALAHQLVRHAAAMTDQEQGGPETPGSPTLSGPGTGRTDAPPGR